MSILYPVFVMALLTFVIGPLVFATRFKSVRNGVVQIEYYEIFRGGEPPTDVVQTTRHWSNLYEAPILFYVVCLIALFLQLESALVIGLAWAYVLVRVVHSLIHLTYNRVYHRLSVFSLSQGILVVMWIVVLIQVTK